MAADNSYEADRRKRVEQNMKRLQEFGISKLSQDLAVAAAKSQVPKKKKKQVTDFPLERRTSSRVKNAPLSYCENVQHELSDHRPRKRNRSTAKAFLELEYSASPKAREMAQEHAENVAMENSLQCPYFIKSLVPSQVSGGFWLGLPKYFCKSHLPKKDSMMILEDAENNIQCEVKFLANKTGLSGGWKGFSLKLGLNDGDAVIFHLVEPTKFKIDVARLKNGCG